MMYGKVRKEAQEIVVLAQVLAAEVNIGYEDIVNAQVLAFNKTPISTLAELAELVTRSKDKYLRLALAQGFAPFFPRPLQGREGEAPALAELVS
jgi:hypothetical protein